MNVVASRRQGAVRQLDVAIELLLTDRDPLAVRTLAAAAFNLLSDLVEVANPGESWREKLVADSGLPRNEAFNILKRISNILKHADLDPDEEISFEEEENDHLIFFATIECGELGEPLSYAMQVFQIWYLACHQGPLSEAEPGRRAVEALPGMHDLSRAARLQQGVNLLIHIMTRRDVPN